MPARDGDPAPSIDPGALKKHSASDYLTRFLFGAGISAAAGIVSAIFGAKIGGVLLAFPAILPASLTLIERRQGRGEAAVDAIGAVIGSVALIAFAVVAGLMLMRLQAALALLLAVATWLVVALVLYVSILWLPRRRNMRGKIARPTTT
jgi:uncharacterized membrane protein (GlpM family)